MVYQSVLFQIAQSRGKFAQDAWNAWVDRLNDVQRFCVLRQTASKYVFASVHECDPGARVLCMVRDEGFGNLFPCTDDSIQFAFQLSPETDNASQYVVKSLIRLFQQCYSKQTMRILLDDAEGSAYVEIRERVQKSRVFPPYLQSAAKSATFVQNDVVALQAERWVQANVEFVRALCLYMESYCLCLLRCPLNIDRFSVTAQSVVKSVNYRHDYFQLWLSGRQYLELFKATQEFPYFTQVINDLAFLQVKINVPSVFLRERGKIVANPARSEDVARLPSVSDNVRGQLLEQYFDADLALLLKKLAGLFAGALDGGKMHYVDNEVVDEIVEITRRSQFDYQS